MATRKFTIRATLMESTFRPAWTSRRLDGHNVRRARTAVIGNNCYRCEEMPAQKQK